MWPCPVCSGRESAPEAREQTAGTIPKLAQVTQLGTTPVLTAVAAGGTARSRPLPLTGREFVSPAGLA